MTAGILASLVITATAAASASASAEERTVTGFGPWRLGMTRDEVTAVEAHAPYRDVRSTGGVETPNGVFDGRPTNVSFVFGPQGLGLIQIWVYSGRDRGEAFAAFYRAYRYLVREFGAVSFDGGSLENDLTEAELVALLPVELKIEFEAGGIERLKEQGQIRTRPVKTHLHPGVRVSGAEVYSSLIGVPQIGTYFVFIYFRSGM